MTIAQADRFYEQDKKKYEINKNKDLLLWLKKQAEIGYTPFIEIEELQDLINNIAYWYEIKYPERELELEQYITTPDFEGIKSLSKAMDFNQLMYRLPRKQLYLIYGEYRSIAITIKFKNIKSNPYYITSTLPHFRVYFDPQTGQIENSYYTKKFTGDKNVTLNELLTLFKEKYDDQVDFKELEECIYTNNYDIELRRQILQLAALKLLYSETTIPERGYERAKRFIDEFNKELNINLSTEEIDEIINRDYSKKIEKIYSRAKLLIKNRQG